MSVDATEQEKRLIKAFLDEGAKIVPGIKAWWCGRLNLGDHNGLEVGVKLPEGMNFDSSEALILHDVALRIAELEKYDLGISMTPIARGDEIIDLSFLDEDRETNKSYNIVSRPNKQSGGSASLAEYNSNVPMFIIGIAVVVIGIPLLTPIFKQGAPAMWTESSKIPHRADIEQYLESYARWLKGQGLSNDADRAEQALNLIKQNNK